MQHGANLIAYHSKQQIQTCPAIIKSTASKVSKLSGTDDNVKITCGKSPTQSITMKPVYHIWQQSKCDLLGLKIHIPNNVTHDILATKTYRPTIVFRLKRFVEMEIVYLELLIEF